MKFVADAMVGRLAKWLRILGFDTTYFKGGSSRELLSVGRREGRIILTRNRTLHEKNPSAVLLLRSETLAHQVRQVVEELCLQQDIRPFSRCSECNSLLQPKSKQDSRGHVPFFVYQTHDRFGYCPKCDRFYWEGTHHREMVKELETFGC